MSQVFNINQKGIEEILKTFDPVIVRKATRAALDKTATFAKKTIVEEIAKLYTIAPHIIRETIDRIRTTQTEMVAKLKISGVRISLAKFNIYVTPKGIIANIRKGSLFRMPHSFLATMPTGFKGLFKRKAGWRHVLKIKDGKRYWSGLPIRHQPGPSIPEIVGSERVWPTVEKATSEYLKKLLMEEIKKRI